MYKSSGVNGVLPPETRHATKHAAAVVRAFSPIFGKAVYYFKVKTRNFSRVHVSPGSAETLVPGDDLVAYSLSYTYASI